MSDYYFTSESVSCGHPDKVADQISDAVLDAILTQDTHARVACETLVKTGMVLVAGEISTSAWVDLESLVRKVIVDIGYDDPSLGFDGNSCSVLNAIGKQSRDIAMGVDREALENQGAGDQGIMFGYATDETSVLMPAPITYAHRLMKQHAMLRRSGKLNWLCPDAKSQVTFKYKDGKPVSVDAIVISSQHRPDVSQSTLKDAIMDELIKPIIPEKWLTKDTQFFINPTGRFVIGGPQGDCGLTGRKIIVDTYGGAAKHGGGAFSGKDPSKVDRSAAYMGRYIAKNLVAAGVAHKCEVQISYAIGVTEPTSIYVNTHGTNVIEEEKIVDLVKHFFDLRPHAITEQLDLLRPIYQDTAVYGHFGRDNPHFHWEYTDKAEAIRDAAGLKKNTEWLDQFMFMPEEITE